MTNTNNNTNLTKVKTHHDKAKTKVKERYFVDENGLRQGLYESFYENGRPDLKCTYKDDKLNGLYENFWENGKPRKRYTYKDDKLDGLYQRFDENGKLLIKCTYKNGKLDGLYESFYKNGKLLIKCTYKDDKPWHSVINTVNKKVACKPIELRKSFNEQIQLSTFSNKQMLELEVLFDNENEQFKKGDKIYLSKELEYNDHAMWLKTVYVVKEEPCIFVPEEFIYVHERS